MLRITHVCLLALLLAGCSREPPPQPPIKGFDNRMRLMSYVLYQCTPSHLICEKAMQDVKTVNGIEHFEIRYGELAWCQAHEDKLRKVAPDKWYVCLP